MQDLVKDLSDALRMQNKKLVTAESCTGGMIARAMTDLAGSSDVFERGFVTYSNDAKHELLNVKNETLDQFGAVSKETAAEMVSGALNNSHADIAVSVTGIAGPSGGSDEKPVGTVCFGLAEKGSAVRTQTQVFSGSRSEVRDASTKHALSIVLESLRDHS